MTGSTLRHADNTPCAGSTCAWLLDASHQFDRPTVLRVDESMTEVGGGYRTMIVTANEPGYDVGPVLDVGTFAEAAAAVEAYNAAHGYTKAQALDIVTSSMFGTHYPATDIEADHLLAEYDDAARRPEGDNPDRLPPRPRRGSDRTPPKEDPMTDNDPTIDPIDLGSGAPWFAGVSISTKATEYADAAGDDFDTRLVRHR